MPNVLVLVLDTVRPDSLGAYGNTRVATPALDRLAREGVTLDAAYSEFPVTIPTRTALVTGCFTWTNRPWQPLRAFDMHIAEAFRGAGYATAAFSDSPFREACDMHRGFETFRAFPTKLQPPGDGYTGTPDLRDAAFPPGAEDEERLWANCAAGWLDDFPARYGRIGIELLVDETIEWLRANGRGPFFCWLDTFQPHEPWVPPAPYDTMYQPPGYDGRFIPMPAGPSVDWMTEDELAHVKALYEGELAYTDAHLARLVDALDELGLADDTIVVALSDHGQPFGEHGTIRKFGVPMYDTLSRIVWIMRGPGLPAGRRTDALVQTPDLLPTLAELCDVPLHGTRVWYAQGRGEAVLDGRSAAGLVRGDTDVHRDAAYLGAFGLRAAIRRGRHKLIDNRGEKPNELYDLGSDPGEQEDLAAKEPDLAASLHRELWEFSKLWSAVLAWRDEPAKPD